MNKFGFDLDKYDALFFDLDGTLIDSMPWHNKAWIETFKENGAIIDEKFLQETAGMASVRIVDIVNKRDHLNLDPQSVSLTKRQKYLKNISQVTVVPELLEIVTYYHLKKPMGIITGGSHAVVDELLPSLGIKKYFDSIVCSDDTTLGKDTIDPYELAGRQLNVDITKCLFFDDGDVGLKGAKLAGMDVVHIDIRKL